MPTWHSKANYAKWVMIASLECLRQNPKGALSTLRKANIKRQRQDSHININPSWTCEKDTLYESNKTYFSGNLGNTT